jgi:HEAT repeat protein
MRLEGATTEGISIIESFLKSTPSLEANQYTNERIDLLNGLISKCNDERYECINKLGDLNEPSLSLILACSLFDTEWEVRAITLRTLGKLRWTHGHFPYEDRLILEAICLCLGDENPIVRQTASDWVKQFGVPDEILFRCLRGITSSVLSEKLAALRVATTIAKLANNYSSVLESTDFSLLLQDSTEEVRILCVRLFGLLDNSESLTNISCALSDTSSLVKLEALYAVCALSESVPRETMSHLLNDPDEAIRLQVLNTLEELGELERTDVIQKMSDSSEKIRSAARKLIKTFDD